MSAVEKPCESRNSQCHLSSSQQASKQLCQTHRTELVCLTCLANSPSKIEKHYTPKELAERLGCSAMTVRRRFAGAPNVIIDRATANLLTGKRAYALMLIPESTVDEWINLHRVAWSISEYKLNERDSDRQEGVAVKRKNKREEPRKSPNTVQGLVEVEIRAEDDGTPLSRLTRRERQVYRLLEVAKQNKEIASELGIGVRTARSHVGNILHKLGLSGRIEILAKNWPESQ